MLGGEGEGGAGRSEEVLRPSPSLEILEALLEASDALPLRVTGADAVRVLRDLGAQFVAAAEGAVRAEAERNRPPEPVSAAEWGQVDQRLTALLAQADLTRLTTKAVRMHLEAELRLSLESDRSKLWLKARITSFVEANPHAATTGAGVGAMGAVWSGRPRTDLLDDDNARSAAPSSERAACWRADALPAEVLAQGGALEQAVGALETADAARGTLRQLREGADGGGASGGGARRRSPGAHPGGGEKRKRASESTALSAGRPPKAQRPACSRPPTPPPPEPLAWCPTARARRAPRRCARSASADPPPTSTTGRPRRWAGGARARSRIAARRRRPKARNDSIPSYE
ncbi:hypothetical protein T492DRAFT_339638 [Pavlovales sp. CCMP2436]|nr:hypothetical protein T492DRAFT_339638 [Pavlovales sp. CCMP2436]